MGTVTILSHTTKYPLTMIGELSGVCVGSDTSIASKNYNRAIDCINRRHGRVLEFPDIYIKLEGWSARVIREWYTHVGGLPTRLQASTRYINYKNFDYVVPEPISTNPEAFEIYSTAMKNIAESAAKLEDIGVPREDAALLLPLGMTSTVVCKHNLRNIVDMSRQRMCSRAYHEYRDLFMALGHALMDYSEEWETIVKSCFYPKCKEYGCCYEKEPCGDPLCF